MAAIQQATLQVHPQKESLNTVKRKRKSRSREAAKRDSLVIRLSVARLSFSLVFNLLFSDLKIVEQSGGEETEIWVEKTTQTTWRDG